MGRKKKLQGSVQVTHRFYEEDLAAAKEMVVAENKKKKKGEPRVFISDIIRDAIDLYRSLVATNKLDEVLDEFGVAANGKKLSQRKSFRLDTRLYNYFDLWEKSERQNGRDMNKSEKIREALYLYMKGENKIRDIMAGGKT